MTDDDDNVVNAMYAVQDDLLETAWGIIANANEGNWDACHPEWKGAAERWRDRYHTFLDRQREIEAMPSTFLKAEHKRDCKGALYRLEKTVHVDRTGRVGNGGWAAHDYRCNESWNGCKARVLVTEKALRRLAVAVEKRP